MPKNFGPVAIYVITLKQGHLTVNFTTNIEHLPSITGSQLLQILRSYSSALKFSLALLSIISREKFIDRVLRVSF